MKKIYLSESEISSLEFLKLDNGIMSTEEDLYFFKDSVFKTLFPLDTDKVNHKLYILRSLDELRDVFPSELCIPHSLVYSGDEIKGFAMDKIRGKNLETILRDDSFPIKDKITILRNIGILLSRLDKRFFINDLHASNILVTPDNGIKVIDLDSSKINDSVSFPSRYLTPFSLVKDVDKYKKSSNRFGYIEADRNSDYYCFAIIILNFIFGKNISGIKRNDFYEILNFLESCGIHKDLIYSFDLLISEKDNVNPYELLSSIDSKMISKARTLEIKRSY